MRTYSLRASVVLGVQGCVARTLSCDFGPKVPWHERLDSGSGFHKKADADLSAFVTGFGAMTPGQKLRPLIDRKTSSDFLLRFIG